LPWQSNALTIAPDGPNYSVKSESETEGPLTAYYYAANMGAKTLGTKGSAFSYESPGKLIGKSTHALKQGFSTISANSLPASKGKLEMKLMGQAKSGIAFSGYQSVQRKQTELADTKPPVIQITFPEEPLQGDFSANPICQITISDDQGLQWQGPKNEIAYLTLNDTLQIPMLPYWEPSLDAPNQGSLRYIFTNLKAGSYDLRVNCWDSNNNASQQSFKFTVGENASITQRWKLYPNPAQEKMTFRTQLNRVWSSDRYELEIFNMVGERIFQQTGDMIQISNQEAGFEFSVSTLGIGGVGFVKLNVLDSQGKIIETVKSKILTLK
jgi:hypothetical protein